MNNINAIVAAWSAQVFRAGLHTLHRFKSVSLRASHGAPHSIFRYEIDLSNAKPIEIPAHLAELLPSEEALQELDNFFPGSSGCSFGTGARSQRASRRFNRTSGNHSSANPA